MSTNPYEENIKICCFFYQTLPGKRGWNGIFFCVHILGPKKCNQTEYSWWTHRFQRKNFPAQFLLAKHPFVPRVLLWNPTQNQDSIAGTCLHFPHHSSSGENSPTALNILWLYVMYILYILLVRTSVTKYGRQIHDDVYKLRIFVFVLLFAIFCVWAPVARSTTLWVWLTCK